MDSKKRFLLRGKTIRDYTKAEEKPAPPPRAFPAYQLLPEDQREFPIGQIDVFSGQRQFLEHTSISGITHRVEVSGDRAMRSDSSDLDATERTSRGRMSIINSVRDPESLVADMLREFGPGPLRSGLHSSQDRFPLFTYTPSDLDFSVSPEAQVSMVRYSIDRPIGFEAEFIRGLNADALSHLYGLPECYEDMRRRDHERLVGWRLSRNPSMRDFQQSIIEQAVVDCAFSFINEFSWREFISDARTLIGFGQCVCAAYACGTDTWNFRRDTNRSLCRILRESSNMEQALRQPGALECIEQFLQLMYTHGYTGTVLCAR